MISTTELLAQEALTRYAPLISPALDAAFARLHPRLSLVARYHHGDVEADGSPAQAGGKALRPALAMLSAEAVAGEVGPAVAGAVAVELVHDFSLLHDDVMDRDTSRRHRPTAWTVFGTGAAVLAGDALLSVADALVAELSDAAGRTARALLSQAVLELTAGQMDDLDFENRLDVSPQDYLSMAGRKTGALLSCSCAIGAALGGAPAPIVSRLGEFGAHLGLAFQLVDDLLGIWGEPRRTGKPVLSDIRSRKKSAPVVAALNQSTYDVSRLRDYMADTYPATEELLVELADVIEAAGGRAWTETELARQRQLADAALDVLPLAPAAAVSLRALVDFVSGRDR